MLPYALDKVDATVFQEICDQRTSESSSLDFKQVLPGKDDDDKEELAKDVSALLNADGGDLVYGISEDRATGTAKAVLPMAIDNFDKESRRITQVLDAWIEPKFHGIQVAQVQLEGGLGVVIRVPASFDGPHCVRNPNSPKRRFVIRNGKMTSDMSYQQIRSAFDRTSALLDQARKTATERLNLVAARKTWKPLENAPMCVAEFVPLAGLAGRSVLDLQEVYKKQFGEFVFEHWGGNCRRTLNLDGLALYPPAREALMALNQIFRNGSVEAIMMVGSEQDGQKIVWSKVVTDFFHEAARACLSFSRINQISGPAILRFGLVGVEGYKFAIDQSRYYSVQDYVADRAHLFLPEVWIEDVSVETDVKELLASNIDVLWQCFGFEQALNQD